MRILRAGRRCEQTYSLTHSLIHSFCYMHPYLHTHKHDLSRKWYALVHILLRPSARKGDLDLTGEWKEAEERRGKRMRSKAFLVTTFRRRRTERGWVGCCGGRMRMPTDRPSEPSQSGLLPLFSWALRCSEFCMNNELRTFFYYSGLFVSFFTAGRRGPGQEIRLEKEAGGIRQRHEGCQGRPTSHRRRRKDQRFTPAAAHGHIRLRPVPALRPQVQRRGRRTPHSEMQEHSQQQALAYFTTTS